MILIIKVKRSLTIAKNFVSLRRFSTLNINDDNILSDGGVKQFEARQSLHFK